MNDRDVLIARVADSADDRGETLWAVSARGQQPMTLLPFPEALDVALTWAGESGGEIYRRDQPNAEPRLYNAAW
jgi:hypothetical protein